MGTGGHPTQRPARPRDNPRRKTRRLGDRALRQPAAERASAIPQRTRCQRNTDADAFSAWIEAWRQAGYRVEWRKLGACEFGAPTVRSRLFIIARADGQPIVWPQPTHGPGRQAYRSGGDCADWSLPAHSIWLSPTRARALGCRRPLAQATLHRIAQGMKRHGADDHAPFTVPGADRAAKDTAGDAPQRAQRAKRIEGLLCTHLGADAAQATLTKLSGPPTDGIEAFMMQYYSGGGQWNRCADPLPTIVTRHRLALVTMHKQAGVVHDVGMRMLNPRELYRAQGFPEHYTINPVAHGHPLSIATQIRMCGNAVCPQVAEAVVRANLEDSPWPLQAA